MTLVGAPREVDDVAIFVNAVEVRHKLDVVGDDDLTLVLDVDEVFRYCLRDLLADVHQLLVKLLVTGTARMNEAVVKKVIGNAAFCKQRTTSKLLVSSSDNIIPGGDIAPEPVWWSASLQRVTTDPPPGYEACLETSAGHNTVGLSSVATLLVPWLLVLCMPWKCGFKQIKQPLGCIWRSVTRRAHAGTAGEVVNDGDHATGGSIHAIANQLVPTTRTRFSCCYTMAKDTRQIRLGNAFFNHANGIERGAVIRIGGIRVRAMSGATLIEDGAITTDKIAAGAITAATIKAGAVTSDKLTIVNGFITTAMIVNAAISDAKIANLSAANVTTGPLSAAWIAAGSITSDKLTIATGFIQAGMIVGAAITSAKIDALDAGKITTGVLSTVRIRARSITADKLATKAIQVRLARWTNSIRISPTQIAWYNGATSEGNVTSSGMRFCYGTRCIGWTGPQLKAGAADIRGISNSLECAGD